VESGQGIERGAELRKGLHILPQVESGQGIESNPSTAASTIPLVPSGVESGQGIESFEILANTSVVFLVESGQGIESNSLPLIRSAFTKRVESGQGIESELSFREWGLTGR